MNFENLTLLEAVISKAPVMHDGTDVSSLLPIIEVDLDYKLTLNILIDSRQNIVICQE